ncbi:glycosyltransferase [Orrella daihaiensis]|uniref:Glycosyltransferase n=1 Tax=Orrella daihaiensis TaxID=2782176 RepID=A0ABY4AK77_9BURK|nr:glycosyltransferase [Orrella daihaiensis]UOD50373.1 glycosyltransferase [Orrella daihaiensis]
MQVESQVQVDYAGLKVALLTAGPSAGPVGGAERFFEGLYEGLQLIGCAVQRINLPADEPDFKTILRNYTACQALDLSAFDVVISTKAPSYVVEHPAHVVYLVHTVRSFDDMFDSQFTQPTAELYEQRARLHRLELMPMKQARARFAIGQEIADRLYRWRGLSAGVIHPPLVLEGFEQGVCGDYFFLPGRLHHWKRIDLIIEAVKQSSYPFKFKIAGTGDDLERLRSIAGDDDRIEFLGRISDEDLVQLYANALAVPFVPIHEDYGYITLEAFASGKPVVTCSDSGEPARIVQHRVNGLIAAPNADAVRQALEALYDDREAASRMGAAGLQWVSAMPDWPAVARELVQAGLSGTPMTYDQGTSVCVLDMQPIDPPVGGGRLRLLGLYHNLSDDGSCTYVGTYDWPGESYRSHMLSNTLREIDVPLSDEHHQAAAQMAREAGGTNVIDLMFSQQASLSPQYVQTARDNVSQADVAIFSHPWIFPLVQDCLRPDQVVIYDSHNVEGYLRAQLLDESDPVQAKVLRQVVDDENLVGNAAHWILACSHEDLLRFNRIYGFALDKMRVVPNGVMAFAEPLPTLEDKTRARAAFGLSGDSLVGIFIGSPYGPNLEAAEFINEELAPLVPDVTLVIAGGVGMGMKASYPNVRITGRLSETDKQQWLQASDFAVNPMMSGSGTNIKMFDFMAMCLPTVTTAVGARGIDAGGREAVLVVDQQADAFAQAIVRLQDPDLRDAIGQNARLCVEEGYAWERISRQLGCFVDARRRLAGQPLPHFSVVIPTYERHDLLDELLARLQQQIERDFEVVIVDQSAQPYPRAHEELGFPVTYFHSPVKGAVRARNTGAMLAQGKIIAFVDDDCQPQPDWLMNARPYFNHPDMVGLEGLIYSDHMHDPDWRPVSNVGFEGVGFMTANLFVRSSAFQLLGGFDLQFDRPHFREDTDLGWRLMELGMVMYAKEVKVFHPALPRSEERESAATRSKFFEKDALLYKKHPARYRELFFIERQFDRTPGFAQNLKAGFNKHGIDMPDWMQATLQSSRKES